MSDHSVVFNMRVKMPGTKETAGQISYEQMMNTFDRTRREGVQEGWTRAMRALREAAEAQPATGSEETRTLVASLDSLIAKAGKRSPYVSEPEE